MPKSAALPQCEADGLLSSQKVGFILNLFVLGEEVHYFYFQTLMMPLQESKGVFVGGFFFLKLASFRQGQSKCNIDKLFNTGRTRTCALFLVLSHPCPTFLIT